MRCTSAVSRRLTRSGELLVDKEMNTWVSSAYCCWSTLHWLVTDWMGEMKEWTEWVQQRNPEERLFRAGLWRSYSDQISHIGPSEKGKTGATLEHCHRHHTLSEVELDGERVEQPNKEQVAADLLDILKIQPSRCCNSLAYCGWVFEPKRGRCPLWATVEWNGYGGKSSSPAYCGVWMSARLSGINRERPSNGTDLANMVASAGQVVDICDTEDRSLSNMTLRSRTQVIHTTDIPSWS